MSQTEIWARNILEKIHPKALALYEKGISTLQRNPLSKSAYKESRVLISDSVQKIWNHIQQHYFLILPFELRQKSEYLKLYYAWNSLASHKKIMTLASNVPSDTEMAPFFEQSRLFGTWCKEVVDLLEDEKAKITERRPSMSPLSSNTAIKETCSCCFRNIAIAYNGYGMAKHGYLRPRNWPCFQTQSCPGTRFPSLERSTEGLEWYIAQIKDLYECRQKEEYSTPAADPKKRPGELQSLKSLLSTLEKELIKWQLYHKNKIVQRGDEANQEFRMDMMDRQQSFDITASPSLSPRCK